MTQPRDMRNWQRWKVLQQTYDRLSRRTKQAAPAGGHGCWTVTVPGGQLSVCRTCTWYVHATAPSTVAARVDEHRRDTSPAQSGPPA